MAVFKISNSKGIHIEDGQASNADVGVHSSNSEFSANNVSFESVRRPWLIEGGAARVSRSQITTPVSKGIEGSTIGRLYGGWQRPTGPRVPCQCPDCQSIFPSRSFSIFNANFYSEDNTEQCPVCGSLDAQVATGLFELSQEIIKLLAGPVASLDMLESLRRISEELQAGKKSVP
ncbi:hypothetical protein, partial [Yoonia sp.]|uniref:hypothetical protein n=1 Tax=Yoonia sp. TaxID=2212373 RepID=UPI00391BC62F